MKKDRFIEYEDGTRILLDEDDVPELGDEFFKNAVPFKEAFPELYASWQRGRGRPRKANAKVNATLRLDPEVLAAYKRSGKGWQTRINEILKANMPV